MKNYKIDDNYLALIRLIRPDKKYFAFSFGDKQLFFERVDKIEYDIYEEDKLRKERHEKEQQQELKRKQREGLN